MNGMEIAAASCGEIYCGINMETEVVETNGFTEFGDVFLTHPDTGMKFCGYQIERWKEVLSLGEILSAVIPDVRYVGWDLVLTDNGWIVLEGNENGEFLGQLVYQKPYRSYIEDMIGYQTRQY